MQVFSVRRGMNGNGVQNVSHKSFQPNRIRRGNFVLKSMCMILIVLYVCWLVWIQSKLQQPPQATQRLAAPRKFGGGMFVCITGQVSRLIMQQKLETLLVPLQHYGFVLDIALVLTDDLSDNTTRYSNPENGLVSTPEVSSFQEAVQKLENHVEMFRVVTRRPIQLNETRVPPNYLAQMDKTEMPAEWQRRRVANHDRQYQTLQKCWEAMQPQQNRYKYVLRIRDDVALEQPLDFSEVLSLVEPNTIVSSDCRTHGGLNDRMAFVSPSIAKEYFESPIRNFRQDKVDPSVHNPESFLYATYEMDKVATSAIRGVTKYMFSHGKARPAHKEEKKFCPRPSLWSWLFYRSKCFD